MNCLGCNLIEHQPRTMIDGNTRCSSCPDWLHECEARSLLKLSRAEVEKHLLGATTGARGSILEHRGKEAVAELRATMQKLREKK